MKAFDVVSICNALYDVVFSAEDADLKRHGFKKGNAHLVDRATQISLLEQFKGREKAGELGGSAMNAIRTLAQLGKKVCFGGAVADDDHGGKIRARLDELNIPYYLKSYSDEATGTCMVLVTPDGERTMVTYLGASRFYGKDVLPEEYPGNSSWFHFCGYQWDTEGQKETIRYAAAKAVAAGTRVSLDLADPFVVMHHKENLIEMIESSASVVFANEEEARLLFGQDPEKTAERIGSEGRIAVIKLGARGALICRGSEQVQISPVLTKVVDTTAAGDMFAAGFLYGLCEGQPLDVCGRIAARLASDVISRYGATLSVQVIDSVKAGA